MVQVYLTAMDKEHMLMEVISTLSRNNIRVLNASTFTDYWDTIRVYTLPYMPDELIAHFEKKKIMISQRKNILYPHGFKYEARLMRL